MKAQITLLEQKLAHANISITVTNIINKGASQKFSRINSYPEK